MPTLVLRDGTKIELKPAGNKYYTFDGYPGVYIYDDGMTMKWDKENVSLPDKEYDGQVSTYLAGKLVLTRGLPRQHPLFFEIFHLEVLMPLGVGELPSWATNNTRYIPFGADLVSAEGVAMGVRGMGPGDDQRMLADLVSLSELVERYCCGLVAQVTAGPGVGVAFYNAGEIQVRGPVVKGMKIIPVMADRDFLPKPPSKDEIAEYMAAHGGLRHRETVAALTTHGDAATAIIRGNEKSRNEHAKALFEMRAKLRTMAEPMMRDLIEKMPRKAWPKGKEKKDDFFDHLDSSINREAHDAYLAAVLGGAGAGDAAKVGIKAGMTWISRYIIAVENGEEPFPKGWQKL